MRTLTIYVYEKETYVHIPVTNSTTFNDVFKCCHDKPFDQNYIVKMMNGKEERVVDFNNRPLDLVKEDRGDGKTHYVLYNFNQSKNQQFFEGKPSVGNILQLEKQNKSIFEQERKRILLMEKTVNKLRKIKINCNQNQRSDEEYRMMMKMIRSRMGVIMTQNIQSNNHHHSSQEKDLEYLKVAFKMADEDLVALRNKLNMEKEQIMIERQERMTSERQKVNENMIAPNDWLVKDQSEISQEQPRTLSSINNLKHENQTIKKSKTRKIHTEIGVDSLRNRLNLIRKNTRDDKDKENYYLNSRNDEVEKNQNIKTKKSSPAIDFNSSKKAKETFKIRQLSAIERLLQGKKMKEVDEIKSPLLLPTTQIETIPMPSMITQYTSSVSSTPSHSFVTHPFKTTLPNKFITTSSKKSLRLLPTTTTESTTITIKPPTTLVKPLKTTTTISSTTQFKNATSTTTHTPKSKTNTTTNSKNTTTKSLNIKIKSPTIPISNTHPFNKSFLNIINKFESLQSPPTEATPTIKLSHHGGNDDGSGNNDDDDGNSGGDGMGSSGNYHGVDDDGGVDDGGDRDGDKKNNKKYITKNEEEHKKIIYDRRTSDNDKSEYNNNIGYDLKNDNIGYNKDKSDIGIDINNDNDKSKRGVTRRNSYKEGINYFDDNVHKYDDEDDEEEDADHDDDENYNDSRHDKKTYARINKIDKTVRKYYDDDKDKMNHGDNDKDRMIKYDDDDKDVMRIKYDEKIQQEVLEGDSFFSIQTSFPVYVNDEDGDDDSGDGRQDEDVRGGDDDNEEEELKINKENEIVTQNSAVFNEVIVKKPNNTTAYNNNKTKNSTTNNTINENNTINNNNTKNNITTTNSNNTINETINKTTDTITTNNNNSSTNETTSNDFSMSELLDQLDGSMLRQPGGSVRSLRKHISPSHDECHNYVNDVVIPRDDGGYDNGDADDGGYDDGDEDDGDEDVNICAVKNTDVVKSDEEMIKCDVVIKENSVEVISDNDGSDEDSDEEEDDDDDEDDDDGDDDGKYSPLIDTYNANSFAYNNTEDENGKKESTNLSIPPASIHSSSKPTTLPPIHPSTFVGGLRGKDGWSGKRIEVIGDVGAQKKSNLKKGTALDKLMEVEERTRNSGNGIDEVDKLKTELDAKDVKTNKKIKETGVTGQNVDLVMKSRSRRIRFNPIAILLDASLLGEIDVVVEMVEKHGHQGMYNEEGITPLHNAICAGNRDVAALLLSSGCDVNAADTDLWTPLHCAASCNNQSLCRMLIEGGACLFSETETENETAVDKCGGDDESDDEDDDVDAAKNFNDCSAYMRAIETQMQTEGTRLYAAYDYKKLHDDELSMVKGDVLVYLRGEENGGKGWFYCSHLESEKEGLVPRNYLGLFPTSTC